MESINKDHVINVEGLKRLLLGRKTTRGNFKWSVSLKQATDILLAAYQAEVEYRHRKFIEDEATKTNIERLAAFLIRNDAKFGVMLCGVPGNGKTTLLYAFQSAVNWLNNIGHFEGKRAGIRIVDAKEVVMFAKDFEAFRDLRNMPMIAIEDMGREPIEVLDYGNVLNPVVDMLESVSYTHLTLPTN